MRYMGFKIKVEPKARLCCVLNAEIECSYCSEVMCDECGKKWGALRHFILDLCRSRFTSKELTAASKCYKDRLAEGNGKVVVPGKCTVCRSRKRIDSDRRRGIYSDD